MKLKYFLSIGIIISLLIIFTGCPVECVAPHPIEVNAEIYPLADTIHVGDTLKLTTSFNSEYNVDEHREDISKKEINFKCNIKSFNHSEFSPFYYTDTNILSYGIENFEFNLKKGTIKNSDILYGYCKEFYYELVDSKFEIEMEIIAKDTGNYILQLRSDEHFEYAGRYCEKNFGFTYFFETDEHLLNSFYKGTLHKNSFYAFVVVE